MYSAIAFLLTSFSLASATVLPRAAPVKLAVNPVCGSFAGSPASVRGTLPPLSSFSNIVTFGDSYTDGGKHNGSALSPPVLTKPNPSAGGRYTNGPVWAEYLAEAAGAKLMDYAVTGAVVDNGQWPTVDSTTPNDLLTQANNFIGQFNKLDATKTLYVLFFGIQDYVLSLNNGNSSLSNQAENIAWAILELESSPQFGKNFLIIDNHGRGTESPSGAAFKTELFQALGYLQGIGLNVGYVDLSTVWNGVLGNSPGAAAFGYTSTGACLASSTSTAGSCADPDHAFYWFPGNPTTATHKIISDYIQAVWAQC
ncbi:hypothetical protein NP233_g1638 [Leucocoprinus birnbaumii]|uniref:Carbohydrate esterase family 16 protein n=1 Tax=Leucocoprinus birnbaumii TaxID=56174 RepID=A0AAD5YVM1_9AGAR|nr:hypothetical protein NP233_g1638 [Leucocoprinus birnbaumii]